LTYRVAGETSIILLLLKPGERLVQVQRDGERTKTNAQINVEEIRGDLKLTNVIHGHADDSLVLK